jgi:tape measure domain-containing protein
VAAGIRTIKLTLSASDFRRGVKSVNTSLSGISKHAQRTQTSLNRLTAIYGSLFAVGIIRKFTEFNISMAESAESVDLLSKKLDTLTEDAEALDKVLDSADRVGVGFEDLGSTVGRFALVTKGAFSVDELLEFAEGIILSGRLVGSTQKEIQSGLLQLSQGFGKARLDGDELKSVMESLPIVAEELAKELEIGIGQLKDFGKEGKINSDIIASALANLNERVKDLPGLADTVGSEIARISNQMKLLIGNILGSSDNFIKRLLQGFGSFLKSLNDNADAIDKWTSVLFAPIEALGVLFDTIATIVDLMPDWVIVLASASAGLLALSAAAGIADAAIVTLLASTSLLTKSLAIIGSFAAGFTFGTYLREEFLLVRLAGISMVDGLLTSIEFLKLGWTVLVASLKLAWNGFVGFFGDSISLLVDGYKDFLNLFSDVPGFEFLDGMIESANAFQSTLPSVSGSLDEFNSTVSKANSEYDKSVATIHQMTDEMIEHEVIISSTNGEIIELTKSTKEKTKADKETLITGKELVALEKERLNSMKALNSALLSLDISAGKFSNVVSIDPDLSKSYKELNVALIAADKAFASGALSADDYLETIETIEDAHEGIVDSQITEHFNELTDTLGITSSELREAGVHANYLRQLLDKGLISPEQFKKGMDVVIGKMEDAEGASLSFMDAFQESLNDTVSDGIAGLADAFLEFTKGGEDAFSNFTNAILEDIARIALRLAITKSLTSIFPSLGTEDSADGNVFSGGNIVPFASGGVVTSPTLFPLANGGTGLMGEAGEEAIIPLSRDSSGKLGVDAEGLGGSPVTVNVINQSSNTETEERRSPDGRTIDIIVKDIVKEGFGNGSFDRTMGSNFNVKRSGG